MWDNAIGKTKGWLFLQNADQRRAPRSALPEIVVRYWDGSEPEGRCLRDISETGAYILTSERWYPGTIITLMLQGYQTKTLSDGTTAPVASTCVPARVVRQDTGGMAVEFAFRDNAEKTAPKHSWPGFRLSRHSANDAEHGKSRGCADSREIEL
jgi:hypothetical protein